MEEIFGYIENITYSNEDNGFTVAKLKEPKKKELTCIVGTLLSVQPGESLRCKGSWKRHPQHGLQFEVASFEAIAPTDLVGIQKYLESGMIKGIGAVYAGRIVESFGINTLAIIDKTPESLYNVPGLGKKRVEKIKTCWSEQREIRDVMVFLRGHQVNPSLAQKIFKTYGKKSIEIVKENPYAMAKEIFGVGFKTADLIGLNLGIPHNAGIRIDAGIEHTLWELSNEGHVCYPHSELAEAISKKLDVTVEDITSRVALLVTTGELISKKDFVWVKALYLAETGIPQEISRIIQGKSSLRSVDISKAIPWVEKQLNISLAEEQKQAISATLLNKFQLITGGPGTGKSTITKAILAIFLKLTKNIILAAPTGKAAKRLSEITQFPSSTIHSLLEFSFQTVGFKKNRQNPLQCDLLIVDEVSMIDTQLMYNLLKAIPSNAKVIFTGDVDQLPSIGPGNVLKDIIQSKCVPITTLQQIFRQAQGSTIIMNAHRINKGEFPDLVSKPTSDFFFIHKETPEEVLSCIVDLVTTRLPKKYGFDRLESIQVLSPMKKGIIGTENLNVTLQCNLNPSPSPLIRMGREFHLGDKVMQIRNNYQKEVFNGDVGRITDINMEEQTLEILFDHKQVNYEFSEIDELLLAYAVSVHKYQGSEAPCVVIAVHTTHFKMLQRNLLYTALTRGKKLVVIVGTEKALAISINNDEVQQRHTGLREALIDFWHSPKK